MPLFKEISFSFGDEKIKIRVNVDADGRFWFSPNRKIIEALSIPDGKVYFDSFGDAESEASKIYIRYRDIKTEHEFIIRYRLIISPAIATKVPKAVYDEVDKGLGGDWQTRFNDQERALNIQWFPGVKITTGNKEITQILRRPTEDDLFSFDKKTDEEKIDWLKLIYGVYYPFGEGEFKTALLGVKQDWQFYDSENIQWYEIELTPETLEFFEGIDESLTKIATTILQLLAKPEFDLLETISRLKEISGGNLLLNKDNV